MVTGTKFNSVSFIVPFITLCSIWIVNFGLVDSFSLAGGTKRCVGIIRNTNNKCELWSQKTDNEIIIDIHGPAIDAIAHGLYIREQGLKDMPLKFVDDGEMEPWQVTYAAGKISEGAVIGWKRQREYSPKTEQEEKALEQALGGRIFAVLTRLDDLEEILEETSRQAGPDDLDEVWNSLGVSFNPAELESRLNKDEAFRRNRARSLLALFLHTIEGPGMRRNNIVIPCMEIDFLTVDEKQVLLFDLNEKKTTSNGESNTITTYEEEEEDNLRPSLHPITIQAIVEGFQLRAQNSTTSPLRLISDETEWYEVQYSAVKFAERFMGRNNKDGKFTEEEAQTIGGRIVAILMRLDDLEWEWNHRIETSSFATQNTATSTTDWKKKFGLLSNEKDIQTLDQTLLDDDEFTKTRSERMLAIFLLNLEGPAMKKSGNKVPGGYHVDFIDDVAQLELMKPKIQKT